MERVQGLSPSVFCRDFSLLARLSHIMSCATPSSYSPRLCEARAGTSNMRFNLYLSIRTCKYFTLRCGQVGKAYLHWCQSTLHDLPPIATARCGFIPSLQSFCLSVCSIYYVQWRASRSRLWITLHAKSCHYVIVSP